MNLRYFCGLIFYSCFLLSVVAQDAYVIDNDFNGEIRHDQRSTYWVGPTDMEVSALDLNVFRSLPDTVDFHIPVKQALWLSFSAHNLLDSAVVMQLCQESSAGYGRYLTLFDDVGEVIAVGGRWQKVALLSYPSNSDCVSFSVPAESTHHYYYRIDPVISTTAKSLHMRWMDENAIRRATDRQRSDQQVSWMLFMGIFFGVCTFVFLLSLFRYLMHKDRAYFVYMLYVFGLMVYYAKNLIGPYGVIESNWWSVHEGHADGLVGYVLYSLYLGFIVLFFDLERSNPLVYKWAKWIIIVFVIVFVVDLGVQVLVGLHLAYQIHEWIRIPFFVLSFLILYVIITKVDHPQKWFIVVGAIALLLPAIFTVFDRFVNGRFGGQIRSDWLRILQLDNGWKIYMINTKVGILIELLAFYLGLTYRTVLQQKKLEEEKLELALEKSTAEFQSQFFTNITHEFRTPLTVIKQATDQLSKNASKVAQPHIQNIQYYSSRLLSLVNDLLKTRQIHEGNLQPKWVPADVVGRTEVIVASLKELAFAKAVTLRFDSNVRTYTMDIDVSMYETIVGNLISNAIKYVAENDRITCHLNIEGDKNAIIEVTDNGPGIPADQLIAIFEPFYTTAKHDHFSSGVGLHMVQRQVELMKGQIEVFSAVGAGTTFKVTLPIFQNASIVGPPVISDLPIDRVLPTSPLQKSYLGVGDRTLLIVEDNRDLVDYLIEGFKSKFIIHTAFDGLEGWQKVKDLKPDMVISDVMMPKMDGFELCERIKNDENLDHLPVILLTAKADLSAQKEGLKRWADGYVTKPFDMGLLQLQVDNLIRHSEKLKERYLSFLENGPSEVSTKEDNKIVIAAYSFIRANYGDPTFNVAQLSQMMELERRSFSQKFKKVIGKSPHNVITEYRFYQANLLLCEGKKTIAEIAFQSGFEDPGYFSRKYRELYGRTPSSVLKRGGSR